MPARTPRRSFATPLVAIIAAAPACYTQQAQPAQPASPQVQPAAPTSQPAPPPAEPSQPPPTVVVNPPRPTGPAAGTSWSVYKTASGCEAIAKVHCPAGASCNPPPPSKLDCPSGVAMDKPITIVAQDDGTCQIQREPMSCPPHAMCNPPRPQTVTCPK